jgi:hypothetical protein
MAGYTTVTSEQNTCTYQTEIYAFIKMELLHYTFYIIMQSLQSLRRSINCVDFVSIYNNLEQIGKKFSDEGDIKTQGRTGELRIM